MEKPVVLVTGASQGLGAAIARTFAAGVPGARLALVARGVRGLASTARACEAAGAEAEVFPCDVADEAAVAAMAAAVNRRFRRVDVLVNNAGVFAGAPFAELTVADFDRIVAANLGIAIVPGEASAPLIKAFGMKAIPLTDEWAVRRFVICMRDRDLLPAAARLLLDALAAHWYEDASAAE